VVEAFGDFPDRRRLRRARAPRRRDRLGSPDDVAAMVLGELEGAMLITRLDGDVKRFGAAADRLLNGLVPA
jgi:hypothetical protein